MKRAIVDIVLLLSIFILPWWLGLLIAIAGIFMFKNFYEFIFWGMVIYVTYGYDGGHLLLSDFWVPVVLVVLFIIVQRLKKYILYIS